MSHATRTSPVNAFPFRRVLRRLLLPAALTSLLGACAISTPFPRLATSPTAPSSQEVLLVVTRAVVDQRLRAEFDRQARQVIDSMGTHPGLLGYSARRQLFGNQAWTMSIWVDEAARARFVRSEIHREAIVRSLPAIVTVESKRLVVQRKDLPMDWAAALAVLDGPGELRYFWE